MIKFGFIIFLGQVDELLNIKDMNKNIQHDLELFGLDVDDINKDNLKNSFEKFKNI